MHELPSFASFVENRGRPYWLVLADGRTLGIELQQVNRRIAMSEHYECFSLDFRLPTGVVLAQDVYRLTGPCGGSWDLLLTPTLPDRQGRHYLEAVFHRERY